MYSLYSGGNSQQSRPAAFQGAILWVTCFRWFHHRLISSAPAVRRNMCPLRSGLIFVLRQSERLFPAPHDLPVDDKRLFHLLEFNELLRGVSLIDTARAQNDARNAHR